MKPVLAETTDRIVGLLSKSSTMARWVFSCTLFIVMIWLKLAALRHPSFRARLEEKNFTAQILARDNPTGRYFTFSDGKVLSRGGIHPHPDVSILYRDAALGARLMTPWRSQLEQISAMKSFKIFIIGPDELTSWFAETLSMMMTAGIKYGIPVGKGVKRYVTGTNGGPVFVYVKDGKILRITPIAFDDEDAEPWTIEARGKRFTPPRKTTLSPYSFAWKSLIYSPDRVLYPMKRVDFDPKGDRHCGNRGLSGYERISWEEALDMVAAEIKRVKREYGPGSIMNGCGSHHMWGTLGYWLSARLRFFNSIGFTPVASNPDSWEGWYWGACRQFMSGSNRALG